MRRIMLIFSMLIMGFIGVNSANAAVITEDKIANVYANQNYNGKELSASFGYMYADGFIAYCIDPGVSLKIGEYQKNYNFNFKNIDNKKKEKLELIAYYGYEYPGHSTEKYYYATQALIWEIIGSTNVSFTTLRNRGGEEINIDKEKNEIKELVNKFSLLPSFANAKITAFLGETIVLEDSNNNYFNFDYTSNNRNTFNFNNGKLNIELKELGEGRIKFSNNISNDKTSTIYYSEGYQSVVTLGVNITKESYINLVVNDPNRIKLKVNNYSFEDKTPLANSAFKIKNIDKDEYLKINDEDIFYTDEEGILMINKYINSGRYQLEQISVNNNYIINNNHVIFVINKETIKTNINGSDYLVIDYYNKKITSKIETENNVNIEKLPKTSNVYFYKNILCLFLIGIGLVSYETIKNHKVF